MNLDRETVGELQIVVSTILFGISFVGQRYAMLDGVIGPITFNAARYASSLMLLILFKPILSKYSTSDEAKIEIDRVDALEKSSGTKSRGGLWMWILLSGLSNFGGSMFQQYGLMTVSAGKVGFITGSYVVVIPFVEWLLPSTLGHTIGCMSLKVWVGAGLCYAGLYLISGCVDSKEGSCVDSKAGQGELLVLISVIFWVVNLMTADFASKRVDCLSLTIGEFLFVTIITVICAIVFEPESWVFPMSSIWRIWPIVLLVGFTEASAFLLSTIGQTYVKPSRAAILYSGGEAISACVGGFLFLGEMMTGIEMVGGVLMIVAALISSSSVSDEEEEEEFEMIEHEEANGIYRREEGRTKTHSSPSNGTGNGSVIQYSLLRPPTEIDSIITVSVPGSYGTSRVV